MKELRQVMTGVLAALFSAGLLIGSLALAMLEGKTQIARLPSSTPTPRPSAMPSSTLPPDVTRPPETAVTPLAESATPLVEEATFPPLCDAPPADWVQYVIQPGDDVQSLALVYGVSADTLRTVNCLMSDSLDRLVGAFLYVPPQIPTVNAGCTYPPTWIPYVIRPGDTLSALSLAFGVSVDALKSGNCLTSVKIYSGAILYVPNVRPATPIPTRTPRPTPTRLPTLTPTDSATLTSEPPTATPSQEPASATSTVPPASLSPSATRAPATLTPEATIPSSATVEPSPTATLTQENTPSPTPSTTLTPSPSAPPPPSDTLPPSETPSATDAPPPPSEAPTATDTPPPPQPSPSETAAAASTP